MGVSVQDIVNGAKKMGFNPYALKVTPEELEELPLPAILFWKQDHFVVLHDIKKTKKKTVYFLADPGYGHITIEREIMVNEWMGANDKGVAIALELNEGHVQAIPQKPKSVALKDKNVLLSQVWDFIKDRKSKYIGASLLLLLGLATNWFMPIIFQRILDDGIINKSLQIVWALLGVQLVLFISNFISDYLSHWTITKANFHLSNRLKENFLNKLMKLPVSYFDTRLNTDTLQRLGDQEKMKDFVTWRGLDLLINSLNIIVFSIMLFYINKLVFAIYLVLSIFSVVWVGFFLKLRAIIEYSLFLRQSENSNNLYEFIMNMPEIKINNAQQNIIDRIIAVQNKLNHLELRSLFLNMWQIVGVTFLSKLKEIVTIALCAYLIIKGNMTIGTLLGITYILGQLTSPIHNLINFIKNAQDASISQKRVSDVYGEKNENNEQMEFIPTFIHSLSVDGVSFKYPGSFNPFVLNNVSFEIPINKITAIVGTSGSGKTTLLKLLLSYYSPDKGHISLNGEDLFRFNKESWRDECAVVAQDGHIFSGTIGYNISFSDTNPDTEKIKEAARIACIDSFIEGLPMAYNTKVGNVGIQLSGGQKQRILIARAVYRNPKFLFFDEATSSLDANSEKLIMNNLNDFFKGKTVVVIAHRLSTVKNADQIIVLEKGEIVETGTHQLLTQTKGNYFELVKNQLELGQ